MIYVTSGVATFVPTVKAYNRPYPCIIDAIGFILLTARDEIFLVNVCWEFVGHGC